MFAHRKFVAAAASFAFSAIVFAAAIVPATPNGVFA